MNALADWRFWIMASMLWAPFAYLVWYFGGRRE